MDKRLEAIQWLKEEQDRLRDDSTYKPLLKIAIDDMENQIPKPPVEKVNPKYPALGKMYYCTCGVLFYGWGKPEEETNYCGNCGQKIKGEIE